MRKIRNRKMLITTIVILSFFMMFHTTLDIERRSLTQIDDSKRVKKKKDDDNNTPTTHDDIIYLQPSPIDNTYTYNENIMINEKDVLYMAIYMDMVHIEFLGKKEKIYSLESEVSFQEFHTQIEQKKLIWIHVVQNIVIYNKSLGTSTNIRRLINYIMRIQRKHIVIDPIVNTEYNLHIDSTQEEDRYQKRLRKLDLVWWHVLTEHAHGYSLTFYTPWSRYDMAIAFIETTTTLVSVTFDVFMQESINFRKSFVVLGLKDGNDEDQYAIIQKKTATITKTFNNKPYELFSMLHHKVNKFLLEKIRNKKYPFVKVDKTLKQNCDQSIQLNQIHKNQTIPQNVFINNITHENIDISHTVSEIDPGIKPIYFIHTGFQYAKLKDIHFEALLAISHPQIAKIYFNILNQVIGYDKYWITRYSPLYVDFSYCILNTLCEECFNEFFHQTEYLLIRDIDCKRLDLLLAYKFYAKFPYLNEVPANEDRLLIVSSNPLKVYINNEKLREFFPKMAMKNMVYCYTEHMLFMRSTLRVEEDPKHPKHKIFDVLIFKNPLKEYITIETEKVKEKETKLENETEEETEEEKVREGEELFKITEVINKLSKSRCNPSRNIIILNYSLITENELREIVKKEQGQFTSRKGALYQSNKKEIRRMNAAGLSSQKEISQIDVSSSSVANKKELKRKSSSSSNSQANIVSKRLNTSSYGGVNDKETDTADSDYSCTGFVEDTSNTSTDTSSTIPKLPLFASSFSTTDSHSYATSAYPPYYNNATAQPESNPNEQQNYMQQATNMQFIGIQCEKEQATHTQTQDSLVYVAPQDEDPEYSQAWINRFIDSELGPISNIPNDPVNSADFSAEDPMETEATLDAYEHNMLNSI
ncbi:hypothetical protein NEFER03_1987 [Nematocida sp. LUAm3]|nr:hypothetical protein NEFER03_1987 [Nematocida sp. LUAm3]KAI5176071.1 hypothetical protein NEFER02_1905 [Nematocida sp. LUAm2]KAI5177115.1 hypothetical protein NEFER01_0390 [Nematocida sp. LUAm1]